MVFTYEPIGVNQIRRLRLQPGQPEDVLVGRLEVITFDENLIVSDSNWWDAISYCWGEQRPPYAKYIQLGSEESDVLSISDTLHQALVKLRYEEYPRLLWADQVCINQGDREEKATQVGALMREVYRCAHGLIVWLGLGDDDTYQAIDLIKEAVVKLKNTSSEFYLGGLPKPDLEKTNLLRDERGHFRVAECRKVLDFYTLPWFQRLWVRRREEAINCKSAEKSKGRTRDLLGWLLDPYYATRLPETQSHHMRVWRQSSVLVRHHDGASSN